MSPQILQRPHNKNNNNLKNLFNHKNRVQYLKKVFLSHAKRASKTVLHKTQVLQCLGLSYGTIFFSCELNGLA